VIHPSSISVCARNTGLAFLQKYFQKNGKFRDLRNVFLFVYASVMTHVMTNQDAMMPQPKGCFSF